MNFNKFYTEARKNPEQNPKTPIVEQLWGYFKSQYGDNVEPETVIKKLRDDQYFISMTQVEKLGINPKSQYDTPLGIYTYPLSYVLFVTSQRKTPTLRDLPFAGGAENVNIVERVEGKNIVTLSSDSFTNEDFNKYTKKIGEYLAKYRINKLEKQFGKELTGAQKELYWKNSVDMVAEWGKKSEDGASVSTWAGRFWYVSMYASDFMAIGRARETKDTTSDVNIVGASPLMWNKLFRQIGIDGFVDYGAGIIHPSENYQGLFLSKEAITVVDRSPNKDHYVNDNWKRKAYRAAVAQFLDGLQNDDADETRKAVNAFKSIDKKEVNEPSAYGQGWGRNFGFFGEVMMDVLHDYKDKPLEERIGVIQKTLNALDLKTIQPEFIKEMSDNVRAVINYYPVLHWASPALLKNIFDSDVIVDGVLLQLEDIEDPLKFRDGFLSMQKVWRAFSLAVDSKKGKGTFDKRVFKK